LPRRHASGTDEALEHREDVAQLLTLTQLPVTADDPDTAKTLEHRTALGPVAAVHIDAVGGRLGRAARVPTTPPPIGLGG